MKKKYLPTILLLTSCGWMIEENQNLSPSHSSHDNQNPQTSSLQSSSIAFPKQDNINNEGENEGNNPPNEIPTSITITLQEHGTAKGIRPVYTGKDFSFELCQINITECFKICSQDSTEDHCSILTLEKFSSPTTWEKCLKIKHKDQEEKQYLKLTFHHENNRINIHSTFFKTEEDLKEGKNGKDTLYIGTKIIEIKKDQETPLL